LHFHDPFKNKEFSKKLKLIDCLLLPSSWEGQPISLMEASLVGLPFVVSEGNGCNDFKMKNPDVFVSSNNWDSFAKGIQVMAKKLSNNQINHIRLSKWAHRQYNPERVFLAYLRFFNAIN